MKKSIVSLFILLFLMSGCNQLSAQGSASTSQIITSSQNNSSTNSVQLSSLSQEQMLEDFDFMVKTLQENYPFWGVVNRMGIDMGKTFQEYRSRIEEACETEKQFYSLLEECLAEFQQTGHLGLVTVSFYHEVLRPLSLTDETPSPGKTKTVVLDPTVEAAYEEYAKLWNYAQSTDETALAEISTRNYESLRVISSQNIAVIGIPNLTIAGNIDIKRDYLDGFYESAADCEDVIFDLTGNGGGSDQYWTDVIVSPNIAEALSYNRYMLGMPGKNNLDYWNSSLKNNYQPSEKLPDFPNLISEDLKQMDWFWEIPMQVEPAIPGEKRLNGRIWVLMDEWCYSSAESFLAFCKNTGFATLVGTPSAGDGMGGGPLFIHLPNSHLLVRYSSFYTLNPDGSSNGEFGTTPDILSPEGESPLDTCLREIEKIRQGG